MENVRAKKKKKIKSPPTKTKGTRQKISLSYLITMLRYASVAIEPLAFEEQPAFPKFYAYVHFLRKFCVFYAVIKKN